MMIYVYKKKIGFILLSCICCFVYPFHVQADNSEATPAGFTVESVIPENQVDITKSYYYLHVAPNTEQTIQVKVRSKQEEPVTIQLSIHDAISSSIGVINYAEENPKLDESLKQPVSELVTIKNQKNEITVANFEEKIVEYTIKTPESSFDGVKLGSLRFVKKDNGVTEKSGVIPEYAYVIALMLTEDKKDFNHGAELHLKEVNLKLSNGRKVVAATVQNDQPKVLQELIIKGQITHKEGQKVSKRYTMEDFSVAPNSNFDFEIPLGMEIFPPGTYVFSGEASGDERTWKWNQEFTIDKTTADKINTNSSYQLRVPKWVPWIAVTLGTVLIGLINSLRRRQQKWEKEHVREECGE